MGELAKKALEIALHEMSLGAGEVGGNNRGPWCHKYLSLCGVGEGEPWCASFVSWCYVEAAKALGLPRAFPPQPGAKRLYRLAVSRGGKREPKDVLEPGDLICWTRAGAPGAGHIGLIHYVEGEKIHTIEGNSTPKVALFTHPLRGDTTRYGIAWVSDPTPA